MAIPLRGDFDGVAVRSWSKKSKDGPQARRLLTLAAIYEDARAALAAIIESGPIPAVHGVVWWRIVDLFQRIFEEFRVRSPSPRRRSAGNCAPWVIASFRLAPGITRKLPARLRI